jgi:hypothetical protein
VTEESLQEQHTNRTGDANRTGEHKTVELTSRQGSKWKSIAESTFEDWKRNFNFLSKSIYYTRLVIN